MKTIFNKMNLLILALTVVLLSCQTISLQDYKIGRPNEQRLPRLEPELDRESFSKPFTNQMFRIYKDESGTSQNSQDYTVNNEINLNMVGMNGIYFRESKMLFRNYVTENITRPFGEKRGYIVCRLEIYECNNDSPLLYVLHGASMFTLTLLGLPYDIRETDLKLSVEIYNLENELIGIYKAGGISTETAGLYYGYRESDMKKAGYIKAFKMAMDKIQHLIYNDYERLMADLN